MISNCNIYFKEKQMRDILNLFDTLNEAAVGMSAGEITKYETRIEKFLNKFIQRLIKSTYSK